MSARDAAAQTALVTGATGFLGARLAETLLERGFRVRALVCESCDSAPLARLPLEIARADLADKAALRKATEGQRFVFHCAGRVTDWGTREEFMRANVDGTRNVIDACIASGVERLVHVSSLTVLGLPRSGEVVDEQTPYARAPEDYYSQTKILGEQLVRRAHGTHGLATTVVRPGLVWGLGEAKLFPRIAALLRKGLMVYVDQGANNVALSHVESLAHGLVLAARSREAAGGVYHIVDGGRLTAREAIERLAIALGTPPPRFSVPFEVAYATAAAAEAAARLLRRRDPPPITRFAVRLVSSHCYYDSSKAEHELGYRPLIDFNEGIAQLAHEAGRSPSP
jgi:nucleoside-diphosphate-sugar epimerase